MGQVNLTRLRLISVLLLLLAAGLSITGCGSGSSNSSPEGEAKLVIRADGNEKTERFKFRKGTPLGILNYNHSVKTALNDNFIECIDGVCADSSHIWVVYINNKSLDHGLKRYKLSDGDVVMFEFGGNT
ncbi:DUF4430 domain-containing protein [Candidatus Woesearchaeota archaeon]|nr:DUF4430 domain-containing protein [Candidatus Woesearchaeota archaeon]